MHDAIHLSPAVRDALADGRAIVALESTVITHGLPYPHNVETARGMEAAVREGGALPATIAVIGGHIRVGLTDDENEYLGEQAGKGTVRKCSRRDLAIAVGCREDGATTVAGTMLVAHMAGIEVFATGGIGGVHRGHPFDVSADLAELGRTPVTVVSSGAKSILDLAATREVLETHGVTILGYGTDEIPAFFSARSGHYADARLDSAAEIAAVIRARRRLGLQSATLVVVPVPDGEALDGIEAEEAIDRCTAEADALGIHGAAATPWLLSRVAELTEGRSLQANVALLRNNGRVAAGIAVALSEGTGR